MSKFTRKLQSVSYNIAIVENSLEDIINGKPLRYKIMQYDNKDTWYADPFILDVTDSDYLILAEEWQYSQGKARISKLLVDKRTMQLKKVIPLLTLSTHLSYPAIFREDDRVYVYPESGLSGKLTRYIYNQKTEELIEDSTIMDGNLADATITHLFGNEYLFCTHVPDCNGKTLKVYMKNSEDVMEHYQDIYFDENISRMAGDFFKLGNAIYRPAQDCNKCYGNGIVIQRVEQIDEKFEFHEVARYFSPDCVYNEGIHTLNSFKGVTVIDLKGKPRFPIAKKAVSLIKKVLHK